MSGTKERNTFVYTKVQTMKKRKYKVLNRGFIPCLICGKPHSEIVLEYKNGQPYRTTWANYDHAYNRMSAEVFSKELLKENRKLRSMLKKALPYVQKVSDPK